ncbi:MAG: hypothetical protein AAB478_03890 [Patescibacteria group bacterium]
MLEHEHREPPEEEDPSFYDLSTIQGEQSGIPMVATTLSVNDIGHDMLTTDEGLENFAAIHPYIQEQTRRGNVVALARRASQAVVTVATKPEYIAAATAVAVGGVVFWHKFHQKKDKS